MTYSEKLKDPRWQKKRLEILERDEFTCLECGDTTKELHVHHRYYTPKTEPWEYENEALATVCKDCHAERTELNLRLAMRLGNAGTSQIRMLVELFEHFQGHENVCGRACSHSNNATLLVAAIYHKFLATWRSFYSPDHTLDAMKVDRSRLDAVGADFITADAQAEKEECQTAS
jgi:hypothetical protein